ncbi:MAG: hypothetical protein II304_12960 [Bacteroidales bacterium]|nr:hypothetical protein [Bacteroidales bacterium]
MKIKKISIVLVLFFSILVSSCATSSRGTKMKKTRKKKCNCPTFTYVAPTQEKTYYV